MTFKPALTLAAVAAALALAACSDKQETSVQLSASEASSSEAATTAQTLASSDGKISITVDNSRFEDRSADAAQWLGEAEQGQLLLLQRDESSNITLAVHELGKPKSDAATYFNHLSETLKANSQLQDVEVGAATENRMNYQFSHGNDGISLSEHCVALYEAEQLYSVCASSDTADAPQLAAVLSNITVKP